MQELLGRISSYELTEWMAFDRYSEQERKRAEREAQAKKRVLGR
ncbi:hypothetical protein [Candidatus Formimonas warabiya]|nr:hypothetical protein [Candidatus Formimonas warabiya]